MSSSQAGIDDGLRAASRIAADPAFSALDASGAPILAACGDPLKIVFLNDSARAVFGADAGALATRLFASEEPSAKRLAALVDSVRHGAALRLERLRFDFAEAPQTVTILCRKLAEADAPGCFVIAALGVRPAPPRQAPAHAAEPPESAPDPMAATLALREKLMDRHGTRAPRFLWKTDAAGRFVDVTHVLADVAGAERADILGRTVEEIVSAFALDTSFAAAIAAQKSWAGLDVDWPLGDDARAPTTLGGLPTMDGDRRFAGFQGYGVIHLDRAFLAPPPAAPASRPGPAPEPPSRLRPEIHPADNVVPLRPVALHRPETETRQALAPEAFAPAPATRLEFGPLASGPPPEGHADLAQETEALSCAERQNFEEIARALKAGEIPAGQIEPGGADAPPPEPPDPIVDPPTDAEVQDIAAQLGALMETMAESAPLPAHPPAAAGVLDRLPVGVLVARGAATLFANRTLLDYLGYETMAAFEADGGLARMFFGRPPGDAGARAAAVQSSDGEALDVDVHLQTVDWEGAPATLVTLRRNQRRLPGPEESALALARERDEKLVRARADNSLLRGIIESSGVAVAVVGDDGRIESATGAFAALFEADKGALDGLPLASLFTAEDGRRLMQRLGRVADLDALRLSPRLGGKVFETALRRLGPAQKLCVLLREEGAEARNIELAAARDAAEQANAAKSDFLARVSHEIRTPLNAIIGFAEVMMEERLGPIGAERYKEYLKDVHSSGEHVLSLVNDLLDLSKIEAGKMELEFDRVDANAVIADCASIMQTQANKARIVMRLSLAPRLPPVRADQRSLKQILLNLLSNALKFNEPGGQVIVSSALTEAGHVVIRVKDTGIGMSEDEIQTALEPFKQVAASHKKPGTGLGLPLTKALIEANHASFAIRSRKNEGTLIEIAFPPPQVMAAE